MDNQPLLDDVVAFVEVARAKGFAAAGRELRVPRSTLSRQLQRLEDALGVRLLERTTRTVRLTEAGESYFHRCAHAIELIAAANRGARDAGALPRGSLRVSTPFDIARDVLASALPEFRRRYPDIELRLEITQRRVDVVREGFDLALRGGMPMRDSGLTIRKLMPSVMRLYASSDYLAGRGTPTDPEALAEHDLIGFASAEGGAMTWRLSGPSGEIIIEPKAWAAANEFSFIRAAVIAGAGIGLLQAITEFRDRKGQLVPVLPEYGMHGGALWAVYPSAKRVPPKVRVFVDFLVAQLRKL
ncbi:MAG TPA: LysR family transcriptional regulator [Polyangiales bacterium]|nr:LysR family transcriptional regulator [Polyangiales bacterium]